MKKEEAALGMPVRFRNVLEHRYIGRGDSSTNRPRKEWLPRPDSTGEWRDGIIVGVRTLANGNYDHGGYDEQAYLYDHEYLDAILVVESLRKNPMRCRPEDVEILVPPVTPPAEGVIW